MSNHPEMTNSVPCVLLAEDSVDDAYFFQRALKRTGVACSFTHVSDGSAAIQFLKQAALQGSGLPDLIFLDLKMPVRNGFEVLEWLRDQTFADPPCVLVLSGSSQEGDRVRALQLGAADYLVKPISCEAIAVQLKSVRVSPDVCGKREAGG